MVMIAMLLLASRLLGFFQGCASIVGAQNNLVRQVRHSKNPLSAQRRGRSYRGRMPMPKESPEDHYLKLDDQADAGMLLSSSIPAILIS